MKNNMKNNTLREESHAEESPAEQKNAELKNTNLPQNLYSLVPHFLNHGRKSHSLNRHFFSHCRSSHSFIPHFLNSRCVIFQMRILPIKRHSLLIGIGMENQIEIRKYINFNVFNPDMLLRNL